MIWFQLCSVVALTICVFGIVTPFLKTTNATDHGIMIYGLIQMLALFAIGLGSLL